MRKKKIDVLDGGFISYEDHMGDDLTVVNAARVSFGKRSASDPDGNMYPNDVRLIEYLARNDHWTPFSHPQVTLHVKAPMFVRAQLFKHKVGMTENEISRRYVTEDPQFYFPQWRHAPENGVKQGSGDFIDPLRCGSLDMTMHDVIMSSSTAYRSLLEAGVAPEQARSVLPQCTYTEWWWTGSLAAYARMYLLRIDQHTQWETRQYAEAIGRIVSVLFPVSWSSLTKTEWIVKENVDAVQERGAT